MIIFTPIKDIPEEFLEYKRIDQVIKFNLSSYYSDMPSLDRLVPTPQNIPEDVIQGDCTIPLFDMQYHKYILDNNDAFIQFMAIMIPAFSSPNVLVQVMINASPFRDVITESLVKLVQQRYGYNIYIVNELEDFLYTEESDLSIPGLFAMDQDIARWALLTNQERSDIYE